MIRQCTEADIDSICLIVNNAAQAYKGKIPADCWKEPYMLKDELVHEIEEGVSFWGYEENGEICGVMGIQNISDVSLIRHAYVRTEKRGEGIGSILLSSLCKKTNLPILVGTWVDAVWAISFYQKHNFRLVGSEEKNRLLKKYWSISERQIETSIVLADERWFDTIPFSIR